MPNLPCKKAPPWRNVPPQELWHWCWETSELPVVAPYVLPYLATMQHMFILPAEFYEAPSSGVVNEMQAAISSGRIEEVRRLAASVDLNEMNACHIAVQSRQPMALAALLETKADVNASDRMGSTPLHTAAQAFGTEEIAVLLGARAHIASCNVAGRTPLEECQRALAAHRKMLKAFDVVDRDPRTEAQREEMECTQRCLQLLEGFS